MAPRYIIPAVFTALLLHSFLPTTTTSFLIRPTTTTTTTTTLQQRPPIILQQRPTTFLYSETTPQNDDNDDDLEPTVTSSPYESGSHEELMYVLGVNLARQLGDVRPLVEDGKELANVAKGLLDVVVGRLEEDAQKILLKERGNDLNVLITQRADNLRKRIEQSGRAMLQQMSETEDTVTLPSGIVIHPLEPGPEGFGNGVRPSVSSTVKVHYHGTLPDGTVFDSSLSGDPVTFALGQVIPGWKVALQKMHEGETAMIGIPPEMGYGMEGTPDGRIPGGATLFFKVQLLEVLTAGIGGSPSLLGSDGKAMKKGDGGGGSSGSGLLGPDGKPLG